MVSISNMFKKIFFFTFCLLLFFSCKKDAPSVPFSPEPEEEQSLLHISYNPTPIQLPQQLPLPPMDIPEDNLLTQEGIELGRFLFFDRILSANLQMSCADCHLPKGSFTDNLAVSEGIDRLPGTRSSMSIINAGYYTNGLFWDGRAKTLEEQALLPVENPLELHDDWENVVEKLKSHAEYPKRFRKAFGIEKTSEISKELAAKAIAQFERTLVSSNSRYDQSVRNEIFLEENELNGGDMFFDRNPDLPDAECAHCHNAPLFTGNQYFNNGLDSVGSLEDFVDKGLGEISGNIFDNGKFRAPTLRNIALTAPYMHDGRFKTLEEVVNHYNEGTHFADNLDPLLQKPGGLGLSEQNKKDLIAFLHTLTDTSFIHNPAFQNPFE